MHTSASTRLTHGPAARRHVPHRPQLEPLEQRLELASFLVNSLLDVPDANPGDGIADAGIGGGASVTTLRAAIMEANALPGPDTITLPAGTYDLTSIGSGNDESTFDLDITGPLTITGAGPATTIIDAQGIDRILDIHDNSAVTITGVTLREGHVLTIGIADAGGGGGIRAEGGNLSLTDVVITDCEATSVVELGFVTTKSITIQEGGAILINGFVPNPGPVGIVPMNGMGMATTTITDCSFTGNSSNGDGGGLSVVWGDLQIRGTTIAGNHAGGNGGGMSYEPATGTGEMLTVSDSEITGNTSQAEGGGVYFSVTGGVSEFTGCAISNNLSTGAGGGVFDGGSGSTMFTDCAIEKNFSSTAAGGGLISSAGELTLTGCTIAMNESGGTGPGPAEGCGLSYAQVGGALLIEDCTFTGNQAPYYNAGGMECAVSGGSITILGTTFKNNFAWGSGGAIRLFAEDTTTSIEDCLFKGNSTDITSGAAQLYLTKGSTTVTNCTFDGNSTGGPGGGMLIAFGPITPLPPAPNTLVEITGCTFTGNRGGNSGALQVGESHGVGTVALTNCTIAGNSTTGNGGGIYNQGRLTLRHVTIAGNTATQGGAGILTWNTQDAYLRLGNTLIANNVTGTAPGTFPDDLDGEGVSLGHNLIESLGEGRLIPGTMDHEIIGVDPKLGSLANNGGPTQTMALLIGSPAINAANTATAPATDQRGIARPNGKAADIGAYEYVERADLKLTTRIVNSTAKVGQNLTYVIEVDNIAGPDAATGVKVTDNLPAGATVVSFTTSTGTISRAGGTLTAILGDLAKGARATITVVVKPNTAGVCSHSATVMAPNDVNLVNNSGAAQILVKAGGDLTPPHVTAFNRFGYHWYPTKLVVTFDELMDPVRAQNVANYRLTAAGRDKWIGTWDDIVLPLSAAIWDAPTKTVTLLPSAVWLNEYVTYRIVVSGGPTGLTDLAGNRLDGEPNWAQGGDFVRAFGMESIWGPTWPVPKPVWIVPIVPAGPLALKPKLAVARR